MKRLFALLMAGMMIISLSACKNDNAEDYDDTEDAYEESYDEEVVTKVNMVYGDDETAVTLRKPSNATFAIGAEEALDAGDLIVLCADDWSWDAEIMGYKYYEGIGSNVPFVDYYFAGEVVSEEYTSYSEKVTDLGIKYMGKPVMAIRYTYTEADDEEEYSECFLGFEYEGTNDCGLMGLKIMPYDEAPSDSELKNLFNELFFIER